MSVVICPGVHSSEVTQGFIASLGQHLWDCVVFPAEQYPPYSSWHLLHFLHRQLGNPAWSDQSLQRVLQVPLLFIGFSAGVVAAIGTAWAWRLMGGQVSALIAIDGWGVPLYGDFPIHRVSHDYFTHWTSSLFGGGTDSFYAEPAVAHLELWRSPQTVQGYWLQSPPCPLNTSLFLHATPTTSAEFLSTLLNRYR